MSISPQPQYWMTPWWNIQYFAYKAFDDQDAGIYYQALLILNFPDALD